MSTLSKFIIEIVESTQNEESDFKPRGELVKEMGLLINENRELREDLKQKKIVLEKYENELKRYPSEAFLENKFEGVRRDDREIINILKRGLTIDSYRLLEELGIDPKNSDLVNSVSRQLEDLEAFGLVSSTQRGWKWLG